MTARETAAYLESKEQPGIRDAVTEFLYEESAALDEERYEDWLAGLTDDFEYFVPQPLVREDPKLPRYSDSTRLAWESRGSLDTRFERLSSEYAWADRPSPFIRHFVSNVRVQEGASPEEWRVQSNLLVVRSRLPEPTTYVSAGRQDVIRGSPREGFMLARRVVFLDVEIPTAAQLAILY